MIEARRRFGRRFSELYATSGSSWRVVRLMARYLYLKLPLLWTAAVVSLRRRSIQRAVAIRVSRDRPTLLIHTQGAGIGDDIVLARFLRDLVTASEQIDFEVACNDERRSRWVYEAVPGFKGTRSAFVFDDIANLYSVAFRVGHVIEVVAKAGDQKGLVSRKLAAVFDSLSAFATTNARFIQDLPYTSGDLARRAVYANTTRATFLQVQAGIAYGGHRLPLAMDGDAIERFGLAGRDFITVHNGFDPAFVVSGPFSTKSYRGFDAVVEKLKARLPELTIVHLGTPSTTRLITGADVNLVGKTTLPEVAAILKNSRLHLDADSGLVHLASALGVPAVVLFGPTDGDYFGYDSNINLRPQFCGGCWWINEAWMDQCPRGFSEASCMASHPPEEVAARIEGVLRHC